MLHDSKTVVMIDLPKEKRSIYINFGGWLINALRYE
mgnify:CR=1 FL=1